jgi:DNA-binding NarL/FixJ family response regulator
MWKSLRSFLRVGKGSQDLQRDQPAIPSSAKPIVALIIGEQDRALLTNIAIRTGIDIRFTDSCGEAWTIANQLEAPVILCDRDLPGAEWRDVMQILASAHQRPSVILTSRVVDDYLWQEVIRNGGYGVLPKPLREEDVVRSVRLAWSYWSSVMTMSPRPLKH